MKQLKSSVYIRSLYNSKKELELFFYREETRYAKNQGFLVPNIVEFMHDVTENGQIGALRKRVFQLGVMDIIRLVWWNKKQLLKIAKKDFATGITILIQIEVLKILKESPQLIILSDYITDLALALNNKAIYTNYVELMRQAHTPLAFFTNNLSLFTKRCIEWSIEPDCILTPVNVSGYEMNPDKKTVESSLRQIPKESIVAVTTAETKEQLLYLKKVGIRKMVVNWFK